MYAKDVPCRAFNSNSCPSSRCVLHNNNCYTTDEYNHLVETSICSNFSERDCPVYEHNCEVKDNKCVPRG